MTELRQKLAALAHWHGIAATFKDVWDNEQETTDETRVALLGAMGVHADTEAAIDAALAQAHAEHWQRLLPPVRVVREGEAEASIRIHVPASRCEATMRWEIVCEAGDVLQAEFVPARLQQIETDSLDQQPISARSLPLPPGLPGGYHRFTLHAGEHAPAICTLIVAPPRCYQPKALADGGRVWGLSAQLYALRSERNWGIGDYGDLTALVECAARRGAALVGVNPLHALFPDDPERASPYSPSSRLFLNTLYLDIEAIDELRDCEAARALWEGAAFQQRLRELRAAELVDYAGVGAVKRRVLELLFHHFQKTQLAHGTPRAAAFRQWRVAQGDALEQHALYEALQAHFKGQDPAVWGWPVWPEAYRRSDAPEVTSFARENAARIEFHAYLQWLADLQLAAVGRRSYELGLGVGLYADLAVSVDRSGAEAWSNQDLYAIGASVGAPPDLYNLKGQNWGLPPLVPERLSASAYAPFIATLRANMRHAGALRIDHVMALLRLYWVPQGAGADAGAYVHYPLADLLGVLALESHRNRCLVIGEDLGTVPEEVSEGLAEAGVLSYRLLYFERDDNGEFLPPAQYPAQALVAASTHDLPTLTGWWDGRDLLLRDALALIPRAEQRGQQVVERAQDRARLLLALEHEKLLPPGATVNPVSVPVMTPTFTLALHRYLARSPSQIVVVQLEDLLEVADQVNLPGTTDQHPNWRRKLPVNAQRLTDDERLTQTARMFAEERPPRALDRAPAAVPPQAKVPRATYRVQLHREFRFDDAAAIVPYLAQLGVSHLYCSPFLRARPGSRHGYDIIDHTQINPEIGSRADFDRLAGELKSHGMGLIIDAVPNHMGVLGGDNPWWMDVLENGRASLFCDYFDIDWDSPDPALTGRVLLPLLGEQYGVVLERAELQLRFEPEAGSFELRYYTHRLPLDPATYPVLIERALGAPAADALPSAVRDALASLSSAFGHLPPRDRADAAARTERHRDKEVHKATLARLAREQPALAAAIEYTLAGINGSAEQRTSFEALDALIDAQAYRLAFWRVAADEINYRRFFDINELAALKMEHAEVFEATHRLLFELLAAGQADGLRIDHPDGLLDPADYFRRLQERYAQVTGSRPPAAGEKPLYVVAEKIVAPHEQLPTDWALHGTTGYRFCNVVTGLFVDGAAKSRLDRAWRAFVGDDAEDFEELAYRGRRIVMATSLAGELTVLAAVLLRLARADRHTRDFTLNTLRQALAEVVACFPVYRTYVGDRLSAQDRRHIDWAVARARHRSRAADASALAFIHDVLRGRTPAGAAPQLRADYLAFVRRLQQFTAPVTAKGIEDTAFYRHHRLAAVNEVGGDPDVFGMTVSGFHGASRDRAQRWPHTMLATSTHDTKRSEDVRARMLVISEMPAAWRLAVRRWSRINRSLRRTVEGAPAPSRNDEYLLYQVLVGTLPAVVLDESALATYRERIVQYMLKAARESKRHTSWISPNEAYEAALTGFIEGALGRAAGSLFIDDLRDAASTFVWFGAFTSLAVTALKLTSPGVPDIYQGQELNDQSLVDPDNRRPVDYDARRRALDALLPLAQAVDSVAQGDSRGNAQIAAMLQTPDDGRAKLWVTWRALQLRRAHPSLFDRGEYLPLTVLGDKAANAVAFARRHRGEIVVVVTGRLFASLGAARGDAPVGSVWGDAALDLGDVATDAPLRDVLSGRDHAGNGASIPLAELFADLPLAILHGAAAAAPPDAA